MSGPTTRPASKSLADNIVRIYFQIYVNCLSISPLSRDKYVFLYLCFSHLYISIYTFIN